MINLEFLIKEPVPFQQLCRVYPPTVRDVIANKDLSVVRHLLTLSQEEIEDEFTERDMDLKDLLTPLEYLLNVAYNSPETALMIKKGFEVLIHETVTFLPEKKLILIGDAKEEIQKVKSVEELRFLNEENFLDFQNLVRDAFGEKSVDKPNPDEDPRIKRMKAKARLRDRVKAKQGKNLNFETSLTSLFCMDYGLNPLNIGELSYTAVPVLIRRYQEKEKYQVDVDSLLAGADSKKVKPKYWIFNIED